MSVITFMYVCIIFIVKPCNIFFVIMIKTNSISNAFKANNTIMIPANKFNTTVIIDGHICGFVESGFRKF